MKKRNLISLAALFLSVFTATAIAKNESHSASADGWNTIDTKVLASKTEYMLDFSDSWMFFTMTTNDYATMPDSVKSLRETTYFNENDYNFYDYIQLSNDNVNYVSFRSVAFYFDFMFKDGRFRLGIRRTENIVSESTYEYVKILQGCEFPSYQYCVSGGNKTKYVQKDTTVCKRTNIYTNPGIAGSAVYEEKLAKTPVNYTGIAGGWNHVKNGAPQGYSQIILSFGEYNVDFLAKDHVANATNRATTAYDIGNKLTINGLSLAKIASKCPYTIVSYAHGFAFMFIQYPDDVLKLTSTNLVPTLHIDAGTEFMDSALPEVNLKFIGGGWISNDSSSFKTENRFDEETSCLHSLPYSMEKNVPHAIWNDLPDGGCQFGFTVNTGNVDLTFANSVVNFVLYGYTISINQCLGQISLIKDNPEIPEKTFTGFIFAQNTDYLLEIEFTSGSTTTIKFAINHVLLINYSTDIKISGKTPVWAIDVCGTWVIKPYEELEFYTPTLVYGGSSSYDFIEGDPVYNFASLITAFDLYSDDSNAITVTYTYEDGAVTDGKYNAGNWTLTITLEAAGYGKTIKTILINVHGKLSLAKISYDDGEEIQVPIGSKLVPPENPDTYRDNEYDYVFDGWYFNGAKWDFANDTVQGDMHFVSRFIQFPRHYLVTVNFEGIEKIQEQYSVIKGSTLPFDIFEVEGATFTVYKDESIITSLIVNGDVTLTVKYQVTFVYVEAKEATCTEDGNLGYWYSPVYGDYCFADSNGRELMPNAIIPKLNHDIVHLSAKDSSCHELGNVDCYYCNNCHKHFVDGNGDVEISDWAIEKKPHQLTHHNAIAATCTTDGCYEYWTCKNEPGVYYGDEGCTFTLDSIIILAFGHDFRAPTYEWISTGGGYKCVAKIKCSHCNEMITETKSAVETIVREATCTSEGQISYFVRFENSKFNTQTKLVTVAKTPHNYVHVDEIKATENSVGVKEHYECSSCHKLFTKSGDSYKEVQFSELIYEFKSSGCSGEITATSMMLFIASGAVTALLMLRRKEEK